MISISAHDAVTIAGVTPIAVAASAIRSHVPVPLPYPDGAIAIAFSYACGAVSIPLAHSDGAIAVPCAAIDVAPTTALTSSCSGSFCFDIYIAIATTTAIPVSPAVRRGGKTRPRSERQSGDTCNGGGGNSRYPAHN
jgi:hypothetical protein